MNEHNEKKRRYLRDNVADELVCEIETLLDRVLSLETKVEYTVGYIHEDTQKRLDNGRETLSKLETALDYLRSSPPNVQMAMASIIAAAGDLQSEQREIRDSLSMLLKTLQSFYNND